MMLYAEIVKGQIAQLIATNAAMPAHKLRPDLLPVVDVMPTYDPASEQLGIETFTIEIDRVVRSREVMPFTPVPEFDVQKEVYAIRDALVTKGVITQAEIDTTAAILKAATP